MGIYDSVSMFCSREDMWVYVDGNLIADLGGLDTKSTCITLRHKDLIARYGFKARYIYKVDIFAA